MREYEVRVRVFAESTEGAAEAAYRRLADGGDPDEVIEVVAIATIGPREGSR